MSVLLSIHVFVQYRNATTTLSTISSLQSSISELQKRNFRINDDRWNLLNSKLDSLDHKLQDHLKGKKK